LAPPSGDKSGGGKPGIEVEIHFGTASAIPSRTEMSKIVALGSELGKPAWKAGSSSLPATPTPTAASATMTIYRSGALTNAVKRILISTFKLPADMVIAVGCGKMRLKNTAAPFAGENRRVRIVNTDVK
jgi:hypothetical protein